MIRLQTLGALDLRRADGSELRAVLAQPRRLALLAYLGVASPHGFHRRDTILSLFWPDRDTEHARSSLNRALYFLRQELGDDVVPSRGDEEVGLDPRHIWCDAAAFAAAIEQRQYRDAVELYRGELLPGFFVSEAPGFDGWLESMRTRLREAASNATLALANQHEAAGDLASAIQSARRAVELAPFDEASFRRLLALLDRTGDRAGAVHAYARFADALGRELEVAPSPETRALIEAIRARTPGAIQTDSLHPQVTPTSPPWSPASTIPRRRRRGAWWIGAATVAGLATAGIARMSRGAATINQLRVDVVPFENRTGNPSLDRLGRLAANRMIAAIAQAGLAKDVRLLTRASRDSTAGTLVTGVLDRDGDNVGLRLWITDVRRGKTAWAVTPIVVPAGSIDQAIDSVRSHVVGAVAVLRNSSYASLLPIANPPPAFEAYQEFLEGVKLQSQGQAADALQHYRLATAIDSSFTWPLVHGGLGSLYGVRADLTPQVDSLVHSLSLIRDRLPPLQIHLLDHMLAVRTDDWVASYRAIRAAAELAPQQYSFMLANLATQQNRPREAAEVLARPGMDSLYRGSIQGYWNVRTFSLHLLDEHRSELEQAHHARQNQPQSSSALFQEIRALAALGRLPAVQARLDTLLFLPREGWFTPGVAMVMVGKELRADGHPDAASETFERALTWYRSRPSEEQVSQEWREWVSDLLYSAGRWAEADTMYRSLAREYPSSYGYPDNVIYLGRLGTIAARLGDQTLASAMAARLKDMDRPQPIPGQESIVFRARIAALLGQREEAMRLLTDAYGAAGTTELHVDNDFEGMKTFPPFQEFIRPKG